MVQDVPYSHPVGWGPDMSKRPSGDLLGETWAR